MSNLVEGVKSNEKYTDVADKVRALAQSCGGIRVENFEELAGELHGALSESEIGTLHELSRILNTNK